MVMSPSSPWTETRGRAAAEATIFGFLAGNEEFVIEAVCL